MNRRSVYYSAIILAQSCSTSLSAAAFPLSLELDARHHSSCGFHFKTELSLALLAWQQAFLGMQSETMGIMERLISTLNGRSHLLSWNVACYVQITMLMAGQN